MGLHETSSKKSLAGRPLSGAQSKPNMGDALAGFVGVRYNQSLPQYQETGMGKATYLLQSI